KPMELTILMPSLNEEKTIAVCIEKSLKAIEKIGVEGEVLVADNGSVDNTVKIVEDFKEGVRSIKIEKKGYGHALIGGIKEAKGRIVIMADSDNSYDFEASNRFYEKLREGADIVIGNRFKGGIEKGAMPLLHLYLGNPVLSYLGRIFFNIKIRDFHCGFRGFHKEKIDLLGLNCGGMEFASEMIVKSSLHKLSIAEIPIKLIKDGRDRPPHLRTWT